MKHSILNFFSFLRSNNNRQLIFFVHTKQVGSTDPNEKALLSKSLAPSYDAMEVADALYPALKLEDSGKTNWLSQAQQRTQALASLESLCNSYCAKEHKSVFPLASFCQLFSQEVRSYKNKFK
jgi:isochorismate hydrolase